MNATPQQMPQAEKEVENFLRNVGRSKKERKPVRPHIVEVKEPRCASHLDTCHLMLRHAVYIDWCMGGSQWLAQDQPT